MTPHPPAPLRPVSEDHRHEPADYELEPNELAACPNPWCESHERPDRNYSPFIEKGRAAPEVAVSCPVCPMRGPWADTEAEAIAAWNRSTQAPRSCWQPIETAPRDRAWVLCWGPDYLHGIARFGPNPIWAEYPDYTHWMPLPEPPATAIRSNSHD